MAALVRSRDVSAVELVECALAAIDYANPSLNAFVFIAEDAARRAAMRIDAALAAREPVGPMAGVPVGIKDIEDLEGAPTRRGSRVCSDERAMRDSIHVERLRAAGAIPIGKTATSEFALDASTTTEGFGTTRNPWRLDRTPGGSSGGSAAAVAAGIVPLATATDSAGSIRGPAAHCGLVGLKPSYGLIPQRDAAPSQTSSSGALCSHVDDAVLHLRAASGWHPADPTSLPLPAGEEALNGVARPQRGLRALWSRDLNLFTVHDEVAEIAFEAAAELAEAAAIELEEAGSEINLDASVEVWQLTAAVDPWVELPPEAWPAERERLEPVTEHALSASEHLTPADLARAWQRRHRLVAQVAALFERYDLIFTPATTTVAFAAEDSWLTAAMSNEELLANSDTPLAMFANLCWLPAISLPAGCNAAGLPVGLQVVGPRCSDYLLLELGSTLERVRPWHGPQR
jgi:aspartyl-tRNA(Asn)/glutamyl-tRNA(Gln) amidotransferase subunit A